MLKICCKGTTNYGNNKDYYKKDVHFILDQHFIVIHQHLYFTLPHYFHTTTLLSHYHITFTLPHYYHITTFFFHITTFSFPLWKNCLTFAVLCQALQ